MSWRTTSSLVRLRLMLTIPCVVALACGCGTAPRVAGDAVPVRLAIQAGKSAEVCFALAEGDRVDYAFDATSAVDFNLHTHRGQQVVMPVEVTHTAAQSGKYVSLQAGDYCLTWKNAAGIPSHISGEWRRVPK